MVAHDRATASVPSLTEAASFCSTANQIVRDAARTKIQKCEKAFEVMGHAVGPAVDVLKSELDKARQAKKVPPVSVQIAVTQDFIKHLEKRLIIWKPFWLKFKFVSFFFPFLGETYPHGSQRMECDSRIVRMVRDYSRTTTSVGIVAEEGEGKRQPGRCGSSTSRRKHSRAKMAIEGALKRAKQDSAPTGRPRCQSCCSPRQSDEVRTSNCGGGELAGARVGCVGRVTEETPERRPGDAIGSTDQREAFIERAKKRI